MRSDVAVAIVGGGFSGTMVAAQLARRGISSALIEGTGRMGREGVAYTFVTTEEGAELTRIEILINRLLKRDEIEGFNTVASVAPPLAGVASSASASSADTAPQPEPEKSPRPAPPGRRAPKRHRRAL